jgi:hypothetical protein
VPLKKAVSAYETRLHGAIFQKDVTFITVTCTVKIYGYRFSLILAECKVTKCQHFKTSHDLKDTVVTEKARDNTDMAGWVNCERIARALPYVLTEEVYRSHVKHLLFTDPRRDYHQRTFW